MIQRAAFLLGLTLVSRLSEAVRKVGGDLLECSGLTEPSILSGTTACMNSGRCRDKTAKTAVLPANTHGGHGWATSTSVPRTMEGSVKPEHSRILRSDFSASAVTNDALRLAKRFVDFAVYRPAASLARFSPIEAINNFCGSANFIKPSVIRKSSSFAKSTFASMSCCTAADAN